MAVNKVSYYGDTLIDLSNDTFTNANQLAKGVTGHTANGEIVTGTLEGGADISGGLIIFTHTRPDGTQDLVIYGNSDEYGYTADSTEVSGGQNLVLTGEEEEGIDIEAIVAARVAEVLEELEDGYY